MSRLLLTFLMTGLFFTNPAKAQKIDNIKVNKHIELIHLRDSVFTHVSWHKTESFGFFPANGLLVVRNGRGLLIDTPMDIQKTKELVEYVENKMGIKVEKFIAGHYHDDCIGGLEYLQQKEIPSIANRMTVAKCKEEGFPVPDQSFTKKMAFDFYGTPIECRYLGGGHTADNIVVYIPNSKVLFGGCLIKSAQAKGIGNTADAVLGKWGSTVKRVQKRYSKAEIIVPGHGKHGGHDTFTNTIRLIEANQPK
ncbi:beta-lactamase (plasmid) [Fulvitalea axinellae]|uniref:beta-lactamase n=1 Tax=Fulvitalea axinellae TaxID=1182444 RepID=A0AAU9DGX7_9BACT|nr:beta-lactamase [Fulvitalea axinellae]